KEFASTSARPAKGRAAEASIPCAAACAWETAGGMHAPICAAAQRCWRPRRRYRMLAETAREYRNRQFKRGDARSKDRDQDSVVAEHGASRPPERTVAIGHMPKHPIRL
ncbi:MAG: hypothetical protein ACM3IH_13400, partial [Sphingobacteriales bacterium]